jgi:cupin 2 domain-containing protein
MSTHQNLFSQLPDDLSDEQVIELVAAPNVRIERIVSHGHASPPGFWYDQGWAEWVVVLSGSADLQFADEAAPRRLNPGDHLHIPAHARHRVAWTEARRTTVWLAVHYR